MPINEGQISSNEVFSYKVLKNNDLILGIQPIPERIKLVRENLLAGETQTLLLKNLDCSINLQSLWVEKESLNDNYNMEVKILDANSTVLWELNFTNSHFINLGKTGSLKFPANIIEPNKKIQIIPSNKLIRINLFAQYVYINEIT